MHQVLMTIHSSGETVSEQLKAQVLGSGKVSSTYLLPSSHQPSKNLSPLSLLTLLGNGNTDSAQPHGIVVRIKLHNAHVRLIQGLACSKCSINLSHDCSACMGFVIFSILWVYPFCNQKT